MVFADNRWGEGKGEGLRIAGLYMSKSESGHYWSAPSHSDQLCAVTVIKGPAGRIFGRLSLSPGSPPATNGPGAACIIGDPRDDFIE